jgi:ubiquinone/menaquinone biosynthesis C-methylase UbiE
LELPQILFIDVDHGNPLPFEDGSIDLVFSQSTLQHIKHKMELILELNRILRVGSMGIHTSWRNLAFYHQGIEVSEEQWTTIMNQKEIIKFEIFNIGKVIAHKKIIAEKFPYKFSVIPDLTDKMKVVLEVTKPEDLAEKGIVYKMEL